MTAKEIRQHFFDFFIKNAHLRVDSAPIVLKDDPTLMFTNAGMNQFKDVFLGNKKPFSMRVVDTQKCLRVSGKHNDLEEVGRDTYHHTMFEMLGNWSFGDYFKKEAIEWAWELLTQVYKIDAIRLYATIFAGDSSEGLGKDTESEKIWEGLIDKKHMLAFGKKHNFWEMGASGPCGPCSEIHIDLRSETEREKVPATELINTGHPLVIELWNLVFIQHNRLENTSLEELPMKHVDTGMGFERLCMVMQGKTSNYDTDVFAPLIQKIELLSGVKYGSNNKTDLAARVIVDHIRAVSFAIADGQIPSNTGAGYVIRRILRRAVRYGYSILGLTEPFLFSLVEVLAGQFKEIFPEIGIQQAFIEKVIKEEEQNFLHTLTKGLQLFDRISNKLKKGEVVSGETVFELYDTYGFPLDLTRLIAEERDLQIDEAGFEKAMKAQKSRSRKATKIETSDWIVLDDSKSCHFTGYNSIKEETEILRYRKVRQNDEELYQVVLARTPFYAESGGQIGDTGVLIIQGITYQVTDTRKENALIVHYLPEFTANCEGKVVAKVNAERRKSITNNHSATHLLQAALKKVLGNHIEQKGSWVGPDSLRFDFSHFEKMTNQQISQVENLVNQKIWSNIRLEEKVDMPINEAKALGAMALFGENYGEKVRVIIFDRDYSIELCGGTHVKSTGQIGLFKIVSESAIAAGIRRIEAISGQIAYQNFKDKEMLIHEIAALVKNEANVLKGVEYLTAENKRLTEQNTAFQQQKMILLKAKLEEEASISNKLFVCISKVDSSDGNTLKTLIFDLMRSHASAFILLAAENNGKVILNLGISDTLAKEKGWHAGHLLREWAKLVRGGGGGQAFFANAGGSNPEGIGQVIQTAKEWLEKQMEL